METVVVRVPPWEVLQDMFPESTDRAIINGETIKGKPAYDSQEYRWPRVDAEISSDREVCFTRGRGVDDNYASIENTRAMTYWIFVEWLVKLDWRLYGEQKILKRMKEPHVHSHCPDL